MVETMGSDGFSIGYSLEIDGGIKVAILLAMESSLMVNYFAIIS